MCSLRRVSGHSTHDLCPTWEHSPLPHAPQAVATSALSKPSHRDPVRPGLRERQQHVFETRLRPSPWAEGEEGGGGQALPVLTCCHSSVCTEAVGRGPGH